MKKTYKILFLIFFVLIGLFLIYNNLFTDSIDADNNTLIISRCTGDMRALEIGISTYAGYKNIPMILSDKKLPEQLNTWLPGYIRENNITKIIIVGHLDYSQIFELYQYGVQIKQVRADSISSILTKIAANEKDKNNDTIILTASDPLAGYMGAYMKTPVFITASNSSYASNNNLQKEYVEYIKNNNIKKVITVGNIPNNIKIELNDLNVSVEEIMGYDSIELSINVNEKLKNGGYINNTNIAYYGFYGELPTIIPNTIKDNAILIEDSSNKQNITDYLQANSIKEVYITRNTESDYIQMEETDYISSNVIRQLEENNITPHYLVKQRTLDEATGLYDMKIITAEALENKTPKIENKKPDNIEESEPPLIGMLKNNTEYTDSNNITVKIKEKNGLYEVEWSTIHPYTYKSKDNNTYHITSNGEYEYTWKYKNNTWNVTYCHNKTPYYNVIWKKNQDNTWTEIHENRNYTWIKSQKNYYCYNQNDELVYYLIEK